MKRGMLLAAVLVVLGAACNKSESPTVAVPTGSPTASPSAAPVSVSIDSPADGAEIGGNVVSVEIEATGIEIKAADGDRSGKTGHYHVFVDKEPVAVGQVIPVEAGVIHSATQPIVVPGLSVGDHTLTVVMGNGAHERVPGEAQSVKIKVKGPSVEATAPATVKAGEPVTVSMSAEGVQIKPADAADTSGRTGHYHVFVDPATPPTADGQVIPKNDKIIHTDQPTTTIEDLAPGTHTLWVVVGDGKHIPLNPLVATKLTVVVQQ